MPKHVGKKYRTIHPFGKKRTKRKMKKTNEPKPAEVVTDLGMDAEPLPACNCFPSTGISEEPLSYEGRMKVIASRFTPGQELRQSLLSLVRAHNLKAAFVVTCVGSLTKATLRLADSTTIVTYNGPFEIVSLVGTLSGKAGHLHISLSDNKGLVIGGHVVSDLIIHTTAEVVIGECEGVKFEREKDRETGFHELAVYPGKR